MSEFDMDVSSFYKEKIWDTGFAYRGKQVFSKVITGFKELMKKGVNKELNGIKVKVLDTRQKGAELEIEIEMVENIDRGVAHLKLYGPNKKKENVVMVTKCKDFQSQKM